MNREQAIAELKKLDSMYDAKGKEARFWGNEYRLAGSASTYVKASSKPAIESNYQQARAEQDVIWAQMVELMNTYGIDGGDV